MQLSSFTMRVQPQEKVSTKIITQMRAQKANCDLFKKALQFDERPALYMHSN